MLTTTDVRLVCSLATHVLLAFICRWSTRNSFLSTADCQLQLHRSHPVVCNILETDFVTLWSCTFCCFLLWEIVMIQMYFCLGNHLATQGFLGWFQCAERKKIASRNICARLLHNCFHSVEWTCRPASVMLLAPKSGCPTSIPQPWAGDALTLALSVLTGTQCCRWLLFWPFNRSFSIRFSQFPIG